MTIPSPEQPNSIPQQQPNAPEQPTPAVAETPAAPVEQPVMFAPPVAPGNQAPGALPTPDQAFPQMPPVMPAAAPMVEPQQMNPAAVMPAPMPETPIVRRERRRPRFTEPPKKEDQQIINRSDLLQHRSGSNKPAFSRQRNVAGDLPAWNPKPPGAILINRAGMKS